MRSVRGGVSGSLPVAFVLIACVLGAGCSSLYGDSCANEANLPDSEYQKRNCGGGFLSAAVQRGATYDGDDSARLWTGEPARVGPTLDTRNLNRPPGSKQGTVGYVGSLRVDYQPDAAEVANDVANVKAAGNAKFDPDEMIQMNFDKARLSFFLKQMLGGALGVNYIAPTDVEASITFKTEQPIPKAQVLQIVRDILSRNGLSMRLSNGVYHIGRPEAITQLEQTSIAGRAGEQATRVVRIKKGAAADVVAFVRQLVPEEVTLTPANGGDSIIVRALPSEIDNVVNLVNSLSDGRVSDDRVAIIPLRQSAPERVSVRLNEFYRSRLGNTGADSVTIIPLENQQAILVGTKDRRIMEGVRQLARQLDQETTDDLSLRVIPLLYLGAEEIVQQLNSVFGTGANIVTQPSTDKLTPSSSLGVNPRLGPLVVPPSGNAEAAGDGSTLAPGFNLGGPSSMPAGAPKDAPADPGRAPAASGGGPTTPSGLIKIVADPRNNTVMIYSSYSIFKRVREVLKTLDVPQSELVIEATVAEVQLSDDLQHGVQAYLSSKGVLSARSAADPVPVDYPQSDKLGGLFAHIHASSGTFQADVILTALQQITTVKVISSPYLTVMDGKTARLVIGDQIPFASRTQQTQLTGTTTTTQEVVVKDTGIVLEVTPKIRSDNSSVLKINQQVTKPQDSAFNGNLTPTISTREVKSEIIAQSGRTVLLGGLIQDRIDRKETGVPVARSLPVVGDLFKQVGDKSSRIELIILITPRVVRHSSQIENITRMLRSQIHTR